ncbi:hypothetical protein GGE65_005715 [Skermanella aerolata]|uniref:DUF2442 domain-containing protein n=1 Tax=Skermanella aerolata TaxID=393310 RepID=UPI003D2503E5
MADDPSTQITAAELRGAEMLDADPSAIAACFDAASGLINVGLSNGCSFAFPVRLAQGLEEASPDALAEVEILGQGYGLHWEKLDVDLSIPGLLAGLFGTKAFMDRQRAARAGASTSQAKPEAARQNGRRGGRPSKSA